mmetsp:Transcript_13998/g.35694  ORF Transcript_13998/g.35694 Transcript_13998/m.35694 type:complete len:309 (-) Transcript_13998:876-1802(-)
MDLQPQHARRTPHPPPRKAACHAGSLGSAAPQGWPLQAGDRGIEAEDRLPWEGRRWFVGTRPAALGTPGRGRGDLGGVERRGRGGGRRRRGGHRHGEGVQSSVVEVERGGEGTEAVLGRGYGRGRGASFGCVVGRDRRRGPGGKDRRRELGACAGRPKGVGGAQAGCVWAGLECADSRGPRRRRGRLVLGVRCRRVLAIPRLQYRAPESCRRTSRGCRCAAPGVAGRRIPRRLRHGRLHPRARARAWRPRRLRRPRGRHHAQRRGAGDLVFGRRRARHGGGACGAPAAAAKIRREKRVRQRGGPDRGE